MNEARFFELTGPLYGPPLTPERVYVNQVNSLAGYLRFQTEVVTSLRVRLSALDGQLLSMVSDPPSVVFRAKFDRPLKRTRDQVLEELEAQKAIRVGVMKVLVEKVLDSPSLERQTKTEAA